MTPLPNGEVLQHQRGGNSHSTPMAIGEPIVFTARDLHATRGAPRLFSPLMEPRGFYFRLNPTYLLADKRSVAFGAQTPCLSHLD